MRRIDKKINLAKANLLAENRYLKSKGLLTENEGISDFNEWLNSIDVFNDGDEIVSFDFYGNPYNIKQNPDQEKDEHGNLIRYKKGSEKVVTWGRLKDELMQEYANSGNVFPVAVKYGYKTGNVFGHDIYSIGYEFGKKISVSQDGNISFPSGSFGESLGDWNNTRKTGTGKWTKDMHDRLRQSVYPDGSRKD